MPVELPKANDLSARVFGIRNEKQFAQIALELFHDQFIHNSVYQQYCKAIHRTPQTVLAVDDIPFLPIQFFKNHAIQTGEFTPEAIFKSSGTTGVATSQHLVKDLSLYEESFLNCFQLFYGPVKDRVILGLLPSYLEQQQSSLVYMVNRLINDSGHQQSGFYLNNYAELKQTISTLEDQQQPAILFGVSYALLDFAEAHSLPLQFTTIIETGGMKGRRKEISKPALYQQLQAAFQLPFIHAEYGMTELLSQAYAINGHYRTPPWMKIILREETDPFTKATKTGAINVIDLANIYSCAFIATDDRGVQHNDGSFEVLGRLDHADVRGCSQMI